MSVRLREMVGSTLADRYRVIAPIGVGGSSGVYLADDTQLGRRVAVKLLHDVYAGDQKFLKRFRAEARSAAALNHPNIMHVYDFGGDDPSVPGSVPFLVMEFVGGGSLRAVLDQSGTLSPSQALEVGLFAARGLDYAHRQGLVHRDIKPANLLFGEEGRLRVADFGLARAFAEASWTEPEGMLFGTAKYASPEQATGQTLTGASDVFSLGLVMIEAVTGEVPFSAETKEATLVARRDTDVDVPTSLGPLRSVLERVGRCDPTARPDAGELEIALLAAAEEMTRPAALALPGAIRPDLLDADRPADAGADDGHAASIGAAAVLVDGASGPGPMVIREEDASDLTSVLGVASRPAADPTDPQTDQSGSIDIPLDPEDPPARRTLGALAIAGLLALAAAGVFATWWFAVRVPTHDIPDLVGVQMDEGVRRLDSLGYRVEVAFVRQDGTVAEEIISVDPEAGTSVAEGAQVDLVVSRGNTLVPMPELTVGTPEAEVFEILAFAQLTVGTRSDPFDEEAPAGTLISYSSEVNAEGQLPKGSPVDLVFSMGPTPRQVPSGLVGSDLAAARQLLDAVQLGASVTEAYSDFPVGEVIGTNQPDGAEVPRDTVVELTVSKGPEPIAIPNVIGLSGTEAASRLEAAGFGVSDVQGSPNGEVLATDPLAGELRQAGTAVRIFTRT